MRSLLFVPAHDERKLAKGLGCGADALIVELEPVNHHSGSIRETVRIKDQDARKAAVDLF